MLIDRFSAKAEYPYRSSALAILFQKKRWTLETEEKNDYNEHIR